VGRRYHERTQDELNILPSAVEVLLVRRSPEPTFHALLGGAADFTNNNLAFEWAEDHKPELDYLDAGSAL